MIWNKRNKAEIPHIMQINLTLGYHIKKEDNMVKFIRCLFALCLVIFMSGCFSPMALTKGQKSIDVSKKSIALLSAKVSNQHHPKFPLSLVSCYINSGTESNRYMTTAAFKREEDGFKEYWLSFELDPGINTFEKIGTFYNLPFLVAASSFPSLNLEADIKPNSVLYLGHIDIMLRERKSDNEERAGLLPLIDAALVGFSTGTFDIIVNDRFDEDMRTFVSEYPALQNVKVEKSILPQWIRPENRSAK
jgi:hypothetical protein